MDDIDSILNETSSAPSNDEIDSILAEAPAIDDILGEEIPPGLDGSSPQAALNKSPLTAIDRLNLSLGNKEGNINYLLKKFQGAQEIMDKDGQPTGELAVQKDGKWHRIDPVNGDIKDPWERAKEYMKDTIEGAPMGIAVGAGALASAATTYFTGGTAAPAAPYVAAGVAGATSGAIRTSLGRIVGTYDATPEEQARDVAFETMLNLAGAKIMAGVKPTAAWVADKLDDVAAMSKRAGGSIAKNVFGKFSVGTENFDTMVENTHATKALMKSMHAKVAGDVVRYHDEISNYQIKEVKSIAENSRAILTQIYGGMKNKILDSVDDKFVANVDEPIRATYAQAVAKGVGKVVVGNKELAGQEAAEYLAKNGLKGAQFKLLSQKELASAIKEGAELGDELAYLAQDREAYALVKSYYDRIGIFRDMKERGGKAAAKALMDFKKVASDISWSLANSEKAQATPGIKMLLDSSRTEVDKVIRNGLKQAGVGNQFDKMNATYSQLSREFSPLLQTLERYRKTGDQKVFESMLGSFLAKPGKQVTKKFAVDAAKDAAEEYGLKGLSIALNNSKTKIQIGEAAKAFNPITSGLEKGANTMAAGMGVFGATSGNIPLLLAVGAQAAARSPLTAQAGVGVVKAAQAMFKGQQFVQNLPKDQLLKLIENPQAMQAFTSAIANAATMGLQAEEETQAVIEGAGAPQ